MLPAMTVQEVSLLTAVLSSSTHYLEFGCGGSTVLASGIVAGSITAVDSSADWADRVRASCTGLVPDIHVVDIGPLGDWGWPRDESRKTSWHEYHEEIWLQKPGSADLVDTYLIDGRFRVACFVQALLRASRDALYVIHDFERTNYHVVNEFATQVGGVEKLAVFRRRGALDRAGAQACLRDHWLDPR